MFVLPRPSLSRPRAPERPVRCGAREMARSLANARDCGLPAALCLAACIVQKRGALLVVVEVWVRPGRARCVQVIGLAWMWCVMCARA